MSKITNVHVTGPCAFGYAGPVGGGRSKKAVDAIGPPGCQSPLNGLGKKIFWGGMTLAEIFAFAGAAMACKTEIEYVDREVIKEVEVIKPQRPTFEQVCHFYENVSEETKTQCKNAYDELDTDYVVDLKYNYVAPIPVVEKKEFNTNTIVYSYGVIYIRGTVAANDFNRLFKIAINDYKSDPGAKLSMYYNRDTNVLVIAKNALNQKVHA